MNIAVIGAGLAGLACATRLVRANHRVVVYDKGRGPGGRLATRRLRTERGDVAFDHGAQYFTVRDSAFRAEVECWASAGLVAPWLAAGEAAFVGVPSMNAPALALAAGLDLRSSVRVEGLHQDAGGWHLRSETADAGPFDAAVVALPAEQTRVLVAPLDPDFDAADPAFDAATVVASEPCWTVMAGFTERLPIAEDVVRRSGPIDWAARNSAKPGRTGMEAWVIHATPDWSRHHLEDAAASIAPQMLMALAAAAGMRLPAPLVVAAHRWRFARSGCFGRPALWSGRRKLGLCGDWLLGPRVECAWMSGTHLADRIGPG